MLLRETHRKNDKFDGELLHSCDDDLTDQWYVAVNLAVTRVAPGLPQIYSADW